ncbi:PLDc N-terminal domain-containing protein [Halobellus ordinarius]|uniref:PLDc N-terminal domain-containing protein n=1 Tax=Halobellus ordinarius TaxID=3075120 RepID=UPI0028801F54|nr:PLDc N-terminal domain-containing protein [Halobellus sp. ZY16]
MATTRSPIVVLGGLLLVAFLPLIVMWIVVTDVGTFAYFAGFALYFLIAHVGLPGWVYLDATGRGSDSAVGWTALSFLLPVVGFIAYYVLGRPDATYEAGADRRVRRE